MFLGSLKWNFSSGQELDLRKQKYKDSLQLLRDTLHVWYWNELNYQVMGFKELYQKDSLDSKLHYLFTATKEWNYPSDDVPGRSPSPLWFRLDSTQGFSWGFKLPPYLIQKSDNLIHYRTRRPYTLITMHLGSSGPPKNNRRGDQRLSIIHTQQIARRGQWQMEIFRSSSAGFYQRQWTGVSKFLFGGELQSKDARWVSRSAILWHRFRQEENGGLSRLVSLADQGFYSLQGSDSIFNQINRKDTWPIRLSHAEMISNIWEASLNQEYRFGPWRSDSLRKIAVTPLVWQGNLTFMDDRRNFSDKTGIPDSFFTHYYWTPASASWFGRYLGISAKTGCSIAPFKGQLGFSRVGIWGQYEWMLAGQDSTKKIHNQKIYHNFSLQSSVHLEISKSLEVNVLYKVNLSGFNANTFRLEGQFAWLPGREILANPKWRFLSSLVLQTIAPNFIQRHLNSNNFQWNLNLRNQLSAFGSLRVCRPDKALDLGLMFTSVFQYLYFDTTATPQNFENSAEIFQVFGQWDPLFFSKKFHIPVRISFQKSTHSVIPLPRIIGKFEFLYREYLFKKKLIMELGLDIFYHSLYKAMSWMPGIQNWYIQERYWVGNYPIMNTHLSLSLKRFRISLAGLHVNRGFPRMDYWLTPHYPLFDRSIRLSLQWGLFN